MHSVVQDERVVKVDKSSPTTPGDMSKNVSKEDGSVMCVSHNQMVCVKWEIPEFWDINYVCLNSPSFKLADTEWFIKMYPDYEDNFCLDFCKEFSTKDLRIFCTIGIKKVDDSVFKSFCGTYFFKRKPDEWETLSFPRLELLKYGDLLSPNGFLKVFLIVHVIDEDVAAETVCQTQTSEGFETLSKNFKELFLSGSYSDFTFKLKGKDFLAHKSVLAARSTVFHAMFQADMIEKKNSSVEISDSDPVHFEKFLMYLYSGELNIVSSSNALCLYLLADKYNIQELKRACCGHLICDINVDSFCDVAHLSSLHGETKLLEAATDFFIQNANIILPTAQWATFIADHSTLANELLIKMANKFFK